MLSAVKSFFAGNSIYAATARSGGLSHIEERSQYSVETGRASEILRGSPTSAAGQSVTTDSVMGLSAVWSAVRILSESIAGLSWNIYQDDERGNRIDLPNHPVARAFKNPSAMYGGYTLMEMMQGSASLQGNGIALINRNRVGVPIGLRFIPTTNVQILYEAEKLYYRIYDPINGNNIVVSYEDVIHIRAMVMDPVTGWGKNPIQVHRENFGLAQATREYGSKFYENGAHPSGVLTTDNRLNEEVINRLREGWSKRYSGSKNAGSTPILEQGLKYQPLSLNPIDADYIQSSRMTIEDIARIFRVPLHMLASLERATFSNIEHQTKEFVTYTLRPWVKRWEDEINAKMFGDRSTAYFRFDLNSMLRGDTENRAKMYDTLAKWGALTINEIRRLEGFNRAPGQEGDTHLFPVNMAPFEFLGQQNTDYGSEEE